MAADVMLPLATVAAASAGPEHAVMKVPLKPALLIYSWFIVT